uniref:Uncharacterized protein n=1 Tax=Arundo donax TaxID=35708 RepID=A0A0A8YZA0_ARUDO
MEVYQHLLKMAQGYTRAKKRGACPCPRIFNPVKCLLMTVICSKRIPHDQPASDKENTKLASPSATLVPSHAVQILPPEKKSTAWSDPSPAVVYENLRQKKKGGKARKQRSRGRVPNFTKATGEVNMGLRWEKNTQQHQCWHRPC